MHSKSKILNKYPYLMEALPFYYGQVNHHELEKDMFNIGPTLTQHRWKMNRTEWLKDGHICYKWRFGGQHLVSINLTLDLKAINKCKMLITRKE